MSDPKMKQKEGKLPWWVIIGLLGFGGYMLWSILFETLMPLWQSGATTEFGLNLIGIPLMLVGTGVLVLGGWIFMRDTIRYFTSEEVDGSIINQTDNTLGPREPRIQMLQALWRIWRPGLNWVGGGILLLAIGVFLVDYMRNFGA